MLMLSLSTASPWLPFPTEVAEAASNAPNVRPGASTGDTPQISQVTGATNSFNDLNTGWVRIEAHWNQLETSNGVFNFTSLDPVVAAIGSQSPRQVLVVVRDNPSFAAASQCKLTTATERTRLAQYTTALVQHFGTKINAIEFYNEPDNTNQPLGVLLGGCFGTQSGGTVTQQGRDDYALALEAGAAAARAANAQIKVFFGGLASSNYLGPTGPAPSPSCPTCDFDRDFLRFVLAKIKNDGKINLIDAIALHYFSEQTVFWSTPGNPDLLGRIQGLRNDQALAGLLGSELKPAFIEESSFTECIIGTNCTVDQFNGLQRNYVPKLISRAYQGEAFGFLWFQLRDLSGGGLGGENTYGLLDVNGNPKPSYSAFKFFNSLVDGPSRFVGRAATGFAKLEGYEYTATDGRAFQIVWNQTDGEVISYAPDGGSITSITDPSGNPVAAVNGRVDVGAEPRYIFFTTGCASRPNVGVTRTPLGNGNLAVTLTAGTAGKPGNTIHTVIVEAGANASVDSVLGPGRTGRFTFAPPAGSQSTSITVHRTSAGAVTVRLIITDDCGDWPTFVGGGANAF